MSDMTMNRRIASAAIALATLVGTTWATTADARPFGGGFRGGFHGGGFHHGFRGRGFGFGFVPGLAVGYGLGYGYPYYAYSDYGYGGCFLQRRVFVDRFGYRFVRPVRVCV
jgi:hypothetical protein